MTHEQAHDMALETLEMVALIPESKGVYVLDEHEMAQVRRAVAAMRAAPVLKTRLGYFIEDVGTACA